MILVLDDHPVSRQGLESIIKICKPEETIIQAGSVKEAIVLAEKTSVDMVFVDINLGKESGFDFLEWLSNHKVDTKILMVTSSSNENDFLKAKKKGVDAYLLKDAFIDDIMYGIKVVERGGKFYSATVIEHMEALSDEEKHLNDLTKREKDVLYLLNKGYSNSRISEELYLSESTVKKHISNILSKLGTVNRVEAVLIASRNSKRLGYGSDYLM